jgi:hypothetical protein
MYRFLSYYVVEFSNIKEPELTMPANPGMGECINCVLAESNSATQINC